MTHTSVEAVTNVVTRFLTLTSVVNVVRVVTVTSAVNLTSLVTLTSACRDTLATLYAMCGPKVDTLIDTLTELEAESMPQTR